MSLYARHAGYGPSELTRLKHENERLRDALEYFAGFNTGHLDDWEYMQIPLHVGSVRKAAASLKRDKGEA